MAVSTSNDLEPSENWDDDFEFNPSSGSPSKSRRRRAKHQIQEQEQPPPPPPPSNLSQGVRVSIASSEFTMEDWDAESQFGMGEPSAARVEVDTGTTPTRRRRSLSSSPQGLRRLSGGAGGEHVLPISMALAAWSEEASEEPRTPVKNRFPLSDHTNTTVAQEDVGEGENWDDDFEDRTFSSPVRKGKVVARKAPEDEDAHESWDEEFAAEEEGEVGQLGMGPPPPASRRTPVKGRRKRSSTKQTAASSSSEDEGKVRGKARYSLSEDGDFYDSEEGAGEFGEEDDEEDRTVTARSKRGFHNHHRQMKESPPPPVPRLPFLTSPLPPSTPIIPAATSSSPRPFPRSPTSSVFSVPATLADTRSMYTYTSTTALRPSISRGSSGAATSLSHLPPSPPIHKDRERRRLRKKSRPSNQGTFEMSALDNDGYGRKGKRRNGSGGGGGGYLYSFSDGELEEIREKERERDAEEGVAERILPRRGVSPPAEDFVPQPECAVVVSEVGVPPATPRGAGALLSRIGSVTSKWGAGRKSRRTGASTTPSEVGREEAQHTPRPQSSMSSLHLPNPNLKPGHSATPPLPNPTSNTSNAPSTSSNWFFRNSNNQLQSGASTTVTTSPPTSHAKPKSKYAPRSVGRGESVGATRPTTSTVNGEEGGDGGLHTSADVHLDAPNRPEFGEFDRTPVPTPAKLVKRKSMGFVALRRGLIGGGEKQQSRLNRENEKDGDSSAGGGTSVKEGERERRVGLNGGIGRPMSMVQPTNGKVGRGVQKGRGVSDTHRRRLDEEGEGDPFFVNGADRFGVEANVTAEANLRPTEATKPKEKVKETTPTRDLGLRSIMGNVRRLSIVGVAGRDRARHKRTQSSASAAAGSPSAVAIAIANSGGGGRSSSGWTRPLTPSTSVPQLRASIDLKSSKITATPSNKTSNDNEETVSNLDYGDTLKTPSKSGIQRSGSLRDRSAGALLPPIELQPPSPSPKPRDGKGAMNLHVAIEEAEETNGSRKPPTPSGTTLSPVSRSPHHSPGQSASLGRASPFVVTTSSTTGTSSSNPNSNSTSITNSASTIKDLAGATGATTVLRRNSLGDLKIPARISQAQVSLRRDLGMVREFAGHVESLKLLQNTYDQLSGEIHALLDQYAAAHARAQVQQSLITPPSRPGSRGQILNQSQSPDLHAASGNTRPTSPMGFFNLANLSRTHLGLNLKGRRKRSSTNPEGSSASASALSLRQADGQNSPAAGMTTPISSPSQEAYKELATALYTINSKYRISWECAELLIELGGGSAVGGAAASNQTPNVGMVVAAPVPQRSTSRNSTRERAVTLAGDDRAVTPVQGLSRPGSRVGSHSSTSSHHPHGVASSAHYQNHNHAPPMSSPLHSVGPSHSTPAVPSSIASPPLASPESWRASTGRHDLSQRQLSLLKEMLNQPDGSKGNFNSHNLMQPGSRLSIPEEPVGYGGGNIPVNREWRWGHDAMGSTITLPPSDQDQDGEESGVGTDQTGGTGGMRGEKAPKRRRLMNMSGFRDMLRALRRNAQTQGGGLEAQRGLGQHALLARTRVAAAASTTSLSAGSSFDGSSVHSPLSRIQQQTQRKVIQKRRPKGSVGPDELQQGKGGPSPPSSSMPPPPPPPFAIPLPPKSPRRPSLASIFRLGSSNHSNSSKTKVPASITESNRSKTGISAVDGSASSCYADDDDGDLAYDGDDGDRGEEDWDQIDSASDLDGGFGMSPTDAGATIRGASSSKGRKKLRIGGGDGTNEDRSGKKSPYLQQDPYAHRSSSGLGRRIVSAGATPNASSSSVNVSQTSLVGSVKAEEPPRKASANNNSSVIVPSNSGTGSANGSVRQPKLSDVQENAAESEWPVRTTSLSRKTGVTPQKRTASPHSVVTNRSVSGGAGKMGANLHKTGSVRSMPPQPFSPSSISSASNFIGSPSAYSQGGGGGAGGMSSNYPDIKLTFTPENIRPLLENAREVQLRLKECIEEMRALVKRKDVAPAGQSSRRP